MQRTLLILVGALSVGVATYMWASTQHWYDNVPGVSATGPLNYHFAKDVALAYLVSGAALIWAGLEHDKTAGVFGAIWPVLHALSHIWMWMHRGFPIDLIAVTNLVGIQVPAFATLYLAVNIQSPRTRS